MVYFLSSLANMIYIVHYTLTDYLMVHNFAGLRHDLGAPVTRITP